MLKNPTVVVAYFGILILLIIVMVYYMRPGGKERMGVIGGGIQDAVFSSGATQRFSQEQSQPGQGNHTTPYNKDVADVMAALAPASPAAAAAQAKKERLVNSGGYPDFWTISDELGAYRDDVVDQYKGAGGGVKGAEAAGIERFAGGLSASDLTDMSLVTNHFGADQAYGMYK
jgi:hypothetical protein